MRILVKEMKSLGLPMVGDNEKMLYNLVLERSHKYLPQTLILCKFIYIPSCIADPLIHHGRHFGRTIHAMSCVLALLKNGILRMGELADEPEESFTTEYIASHLDGMTGKSYFILSRERREHRVFRSLLNSIPGLEERLMASTDEEVRMIADLVGDLDVIRRSRLIFSVI
jgi:hypothetical protein